MGTLPAAKLTKIWYTHQSIYNDFNHHKKISGIIVQPKY